VEFYFVFDWEVKMKIEIEIQDPPEGWVYDGFREARVGERYWHGTHKTWAGPCRLPTGVHFAVAIKATPLWEPSPELVAALKPGWIVRDESGEYWWYEDKPDRRSSDWCGAYGGAELGEMLAIKETLLPPASIPWDKCCFRIGGEE